MPGLPRAASNLADELCRRIHASALKTTSYGSTISCWSTRKDFEEVDVADEALKVIRQAALSHLSITPYSYRKVGARSTLRELVIPFAATGYILRFDIRSPTLVLVLGARHQREEDFH